MMIVIVRLKKETKIVPSKKVISDISILIKTDHHENTQHTVLMIIFSQQIRIGMVDSN